MSVTVVIPHFWGYLVNGVKEVDVDCRTIGECLTALTEHFPQLNDLLFDKKGRLHGFIDITVNEKSAYPDELNKPVNDGDKVFIANIIAGG
ncbi:MAG: MoaD/ThiS family protein [Dehalococcoidia bacterium]|nr:MoaD/ThiS family protein [Dehalococcoidia bacterium]